MKPRNFVGQVFAFLGGPDDPRPQDMGWVEINHTSSSSEIREWFIKQCQMKNTCRVIEHLAEGRHECSDVYCLIIACAYQGRIFSSEWTDDRAPWSNLFVGMENPVPEYQSQTP